MVPHQFLHTPPDPNLYSNEFAVDFRMLFHRFHNSQPEPTHLHGISLWVTNFTSGPSLRPLRSTGILTSQAAVSSWNLPTPYYVIEEMSWYKKYVQNNVCQTATINFQSTVCHRIYRSWWRTVDIMCWRRHTSPDIQNTSPDIQNTNYICVYTYIYI